MKIIKIIKMKWPTLLLSFVAVFGKATAQRAIDYYPLRVGNYWIQQSDSLNGEYRPTTFRMEIENVDTIGDITFYRLKQTHTEQGGSGDQTPWYSWLRPETEGIFMGAWGHTPEILELEIPTQNIDVDGDPNDWTGIDALATDPQGDDPINFTGDDIQALYVAQDAENLYIRMDLWENVNTDFRNEQTPFGGRYILAISITRYDIPMYFGIAYSDTLDQWSLGHNGSSEDVPEGLEGPEYVGVNNNVIELRIPFASIDNATDFSMIAGYVIVPGGQSPEENIDFLEFMPTSVWDPPGLWFPNTLTTPGSTWEIDSPEMGGYFIYSTVSNSATLQTPAGTFQNCLEIQLTMLTEAQGDLLQSNTFYYAPGVGEVLNRGWSFWQGNFEFVLQEYFVEIPDVTIQTAFEEPVAGDALTITAAVPQDFLATEGTLYYRMGGRTAYREEEMTLNGGGFEGSIPALFVTLRGIEYYVVITDGLTESTFPLTDAENNPAVIRVNVDRHQLRLFVPASEYKMISVPIQLENPGIDAVLLDDYGEYDRALWRLAQYRLQDTTYYDEYPNIEAEFTPGTALWLIHRAGIDFDVENGLSMDSSQPVTLFLNSGWNQVGNPFPFDVSWSSINIQGDVEEPAYYNGEDYEYNVTTLEPWEGYFIQNRGTSQATLTFTPIEAENRIIPKPNPLKYASSEDEFVLRLVADIPGFDLIDSQNYIGWLHHASTGIDSFDISEAPPIGDYVRLSIIEDGERMAGSYKPIPKGGHQWLLELDNTLPVEREVRIRIVESGPLPDGMQLYVLDRDYRCALPVTDQTFKIRTAEAYPVRHMQVILGSESYAESRTDGIALTPLEFTLFQNYPNPFNGQTVIAYRLVKRDRVRIDVFNILGHHVRRLVDRTQEPGTQSVIWYGEDDAGNTAAGGVYFYRIRTAGYVNTKKLVFIR